jgi:glutathione S-transferase
MDWFNTQFYRDFGYGLVYPQLFPHHKRRSDEAHAGAIDWGQQGARKWLQILNDRWIGPDNAYLSGNELTIADYFGSSIVSIGELVGCDFAGYPNVQRWLGNMRKLKAWDAVNECVQRLCRNEQGQGIRAAIGSTAARTADNEPTIGAAAAFRANA